jgi:hypothetical protein
LAKKAYLFSLINFFSLLLPFGKTLNRIKTESTKNYGRPYNEVMKETRERYFNDSYKQNIVKEFEPL